jgi:hypothetical protein
MVDLPMPEDYDFDAAIVHHNRVCEINLRHLTSSQLKRLASAMQEQFPALIHLMLGYASNYSRPALALSDGFLGGSAPLLQSLRLHSIPFPALPKLLLSATHLVYLALVGIPHSGYISPEAIVTGLAVLTNLKSLTIEFESPLSRPDRENRRPPPPRRIILPALARFEFQGVSEYLEDLVARIDAPFLDSIWITFFHQLIFNIPLLAQLLRRTTSFGALNEAHVDFDYYGLVVRSLPLPRISDEKSGLIITCADDGWQFSSLVPVFMSFFPSIFMVEHLYIHATANVLSQDDLEDMQLLENFPAFALAFASVKNLYLRMAFAEFFAPILQEHVLGTATDVLPALESLCLEEVEPSEPLREALGQFVATRRLLGHPVAISYRNWVREVSSRRS